MIEVENTIRAEITHVRRMYNGQYEVTIRLKDATGVVTNTNFVYIANETDVRPGQWVDVTIKVEV